MSAQPEPRINYPCAWSYKVVGADVLRLRSAIYTAIGDRPHTVRLSRQSKGGKYVSLHVQMIVHDHDERRGVGDSLHSNDDVLFVL